jgi:uncharacterized protein (DUF2062 family)
MDNSAPSGMKQRIQRWIGRAKKLNGDPHYVAMGMAIGVFVALTPTIPFHTLIAIVLSFILRASKVAASIGVWISNPITIPFFYLASYKAGTFLFSISGPYNFTAESVSDMLKMGLNITIAAISGGIILGILPAIAAYFITRKIVSNIRSREKLFRKRACDSRL